MSRWKCPDCGGWVADTVAVHHCGAAPATGTNSMLTCSTCGTLYMRGTVHVCRISFAFVPVTQGAPPVVFALASRS